MLMPEGRHKTVPIQVWVDVDEGIAEIVAYLNTIPGVRTDASCQGTIGEGGPSPYRAQVMATWTDEAFQQLKREFDVTLEGENWGYLHPRTTEVAVGDNRRSMKMTADPEAIRHIRALMSALDDVIRRYPTRVIRGGGRYNAADVYLFRAELPGQTVEAGGDQIELLLCAAADALESRSLFEKSGEPFLRCNICLTPADEELGPQHVPGCFIHTLREVLATLTAERDALRERVRRETLEEAAKVAMDRNIDRAGGFGNDCKRAEAITIAHYIRALGDQSKEQG